MDALDRNITVPRGPKFYRGDDGEVWFEFVLDPTNRIGPRPATAGDRSLHADAYRLFSSRDMGEAQAVAPESPNRLAQVEEIAGRGKTQLTAAQVKALDRDKDGKAGGSLARHPPGSVIPASKIADVRSDPSADEPGATVELVTDDGVTSGVLNADGSVTVTASALSAPKKAPAKKKAAPRTAKRKG